MQVSNLRADEKRQVVDALALLPRHEYVDSTVRALIVRRGWASRLVDAGRSSSILSPAARTW